MPFASERQRRWMHANKPTMAKQWERETPKGSKLPEKAPEHGAQNDPGRTVDDIEKGAAGIMFSACADELRSILS
jgi:hypothetical protein